MGLASRIIFLIFVSTSERADNFFSHLVSTRTAGQGGYRRGPLQPHARWLVEGREGKGAHCSRRRGGVFSGQGRLSL